MIARIMLAVNLLAVSVSAMGDDTSDLFTIGSPAPALDVAHWVQDGNGRFAAVTEFEAGKVYVVEFWATWCGPCIASMPHLAETQLKYADQGVQLISVSDEDLETVKKFLERKVQGAEEEEQTYGQLTSAYCLTTDPDRSTHAAYMEAAGQSGIPTAFIVGKTGQVEWIGHPMSMDSVLASVVEGQWDREPFRKEFEAQQGFSRARIRAGRAMQDGDVEKAIAILDEFAEQHPDSPSIANIQFMKFQIAVQAGKNEAAEEALNAVLANMKGTPTTVNSLAFSMLQLNRQQKLPEGVLAGVRDALAAEVDGAAKPLRPILLNNLAALQAELGLWKEAVELQERAVAEATGSQKKQYESVLERLKRDAAASQEK